MKRSIFRWIHIVFAIPIIGYIYSPFKELPNYAPVVRYVAIPVIAFTGLWMWKGDVLRRLISKKSAKTTQQLKRKTI
jgi:predicted tellurium resistance membrane protein TerC